jgi:hypothetical protein
VPATAAIDNETLDHLLSDGLTTNTLSLWALAAIRKVIQPAL